MRQRVAFASLAGAAALIAAASCAADHGDPTKASGDPGDGASSGDVAPGGDSGESGTRDAAPEGGGSEGGGSDDATSDGSSGSEASGSSSGGGPSDGATGSDGPGTPGDASDGANDAVTRDGPTESAVADGTDSRAEGGGGAPDGETEAAILDGGASPDASVSPEAAPPVGGSCLVASCPLKVQWQIPSGAANTISADLNIVNTGTAAVDLADVRVRYFFTADGDPALVFNCDYAGYFQTNMTGFSATDVTGAFLPFASSPSPLADTILELSFASAPLPAGATVSVNFRVHDASFATNYDQTNDWSRAFSTTSATTYVDADEITAYLAGTLAWGAEPAATPPGGPTD